MHIHEQVLQAANAIAASHPQWQFSLVQVLRTLPHLNDSSVRTHVVSRCCIDAPKNHLHKWDYFRRVGRGVYQVAPKYRQKPSSSASATVAKHSGASRQLRSTVHAVIEKSDSSYVAECLELAIVTQGSTLDETVDNLRQALALHLEGEDLQALGLQKNPRLQIVYEVAQTL